MFKKRPVLLLIVLLLVAAASFAYWLATRPDSTANQNVSTANKLAQSVDSEVQNATNPLLGKNFYADPEREVGKLASQYRQQGNMENAALMDKIAGQPAAIWLLGPSSSDIAAERDMRQIARTSTEALAQGTVPVYQLYAIPHRDGCANYSKGGFTNAQQYHAWLDRVLATLKTEAVFTVEADAVAQTVTGGCLSKQQITDRMQLLNTAMTKLSEHPKVLAAYLDAGHSEWFSSPEQLVEPLRAAGVDKGRGIVTNVSFFEETSVITAWSQKLVQLLGGDKGLVIDTSRNGKGVPPPSVTGEKRWCNPAGRGLGPRPTVVSDVPNVDAYLWVKAAGESDGACFGNPAAGMFAPAIALELARNAIDKTL